MKSKFNLTYQLLTEKNINIAYEIQKKVWPEDPDYNDFLEKITETAPDNCFFLVYDQNTLIGLVGVEIYDEYPDTIWLDWFTVLEEFRQKGYGTKILTDIIHYCKNLNKFDYIRLETTFYERRPALFLYDKIMHFKEPYTIEDTKTKKNNFLIYTYCLTEKKELWNNRYLGLREYYDNLNHQ